MILGMAPRVEMTCVLTLQEPVTLLWVAISECLTEWIDNGSSPFLRDLLSARK